MNPPMVNRVVLWYKMTNPKKLPFWYWLIRWIDRWWWIEWITQIMRKPFGLPSSNLLEMTNQYNYGKVCWWDSHSSQQNYNVHTNRDSTLLTKTYLSDHKKKSLKLSVNTKYHNKLHFLINFCLTVIKCNSVIQIIVNVAHSDSDSEVVVQFPTFLYIDL